MSAALRLSTLTVLLAGTIAAGPMLSARAQTPAASSTPAAASAAPTKRDASVEKRITFLRTQLKITPEEEKPFDDFAEVMRANTARMDGLVAKRVDLPANATAVDHLNAYNAMAQAHAQDMQQLSTAFATLYDSLSPQQKKLADQDFRRFGGERRTDRS